MKQVKYYLTNERLKYKFKSFFELSNIGIKIAKEIIARESNITLQKVIHELELLPDTINH
ncbi:MAG: hypothetical protein A2888_02810 [Chlamydiae bacterium RIFCSPLOWO2_01_FULL_28_7]|nr:MAG: hypothetical protein A2888_02810 [Chlamydiae bacterium RIFCSPLOWO2_01_FULL_28_7]